MPPLAVCSWSLRPDSPTDLVDKVAQCGLDAVQLALDPLREPAWARATLRASLEQHHFRVVSGMIAMHAEDYSTLDAIRQTGGVRPDAHWERNLTNAKACAVIAADLGLRLVTFHAGFLPEDPADPLRATMTARVRTIADLFAHHAIDLALETGQEDAHTLLGVLAEINHPSVGVNFDPANMLLYGMGDPVESLTLLAPHVRQIHIKDADPSPTPGLWGREQVVGEGSVDWDAFLRVVRERLPGVPLVIEREDGDARVDDVRTAAAFLHARGVQS